MKKILLITFFTINVLGCSQKKESQNEIVVDTTIPTEKPKIQSYEEIKAREAKVDKWLYKNETDKMTNQVNKFAILDADNSLSLSSPYDGITTGSLTIRKKRNSLNVIMQISSGQIVSQSYDDKFVLVKFDDKPAKRWSYTESGDYDSKVIFLNSEKSFLEKLKKSKKVIIEFTVYQDGNQQLEFTTQNLNF